MSPLPLRLLAIAALLTGCTTELEYEGAFIVPAAGDITQPDRPGPFTETVAWIASRDGGQIRAIAAESGRFLSDDPAASFLRGSPLPTGQRRSLSDVAAWVPSAERATIFAADQAWGQLLEVPHVIGFQAGAPVERVVSVSEVTASGGGSLSELVVHDGFASTETWTLTWDGAAWRASGSRSGPLGGKAVPGEPYTPTSQAFTLTATEGAAVGDTLTFQTDSGLIEHDLGAAPVTLATSPDQSVIAVSAVGADGSGELLWWDPETAEVIGQVDLPAGRRPGALAWHGDTLWVADHVVEVDLTGEPIGGALWRVSKGSTEAERIDIEGPAQHLAPAPDQDRLYYVLAGDPQLRALSLQDGTILDLDRIRPDSTAFPMHSPVQGLTALPGTVTQLDDDDDQQPRTSEVLAITLYLGTVVFYDHATGCLLEDGFGPRTEPEARSLQTNDIDYNWDFDGARGGPSLASNAANSNHVVVNGCAGIARDEAWRLIFDGEALAWQVEGQLSGVQQNMAVEGVRYVSDDGAISFLIQPGATPSQDGWTMQFVTVDGVLGAAGDRDDDGVIDRTNSEFTWSLPGPPLPVLLPAAGTRETDTPAVIVPLEGNGLVVRARPDSGITDAVWE